MKSYTMHMLVALIAVCTLGVSACGEEGDAPQVEGYHDVVYAGAGASQAEESLYVFPERLMQQKVRWEPCDLYEGYPDKGSAQCAYFLVPQTWAGSHQERIVIRVKRLRGSGELTRQLWMLGDGPGASAIADFGPLMDRLSSLDPHLDIYVPDHRGVGFSSRLGCPYQEAPDSDGGIAITEEELYDCAVYLKKYSGYDPAAFSVSMAADDLAFLMAYNRADGVDQFVYGLGYGTYLAHRYAQIYEKQPSGVILDSIMTPDYYFMDISDRRTEAALHGIFDACAQDVVCSSKLGTNPWLYARNTFEAFVEGHCSALADAGVTPDAFKRMVYALGLYRDTSVHLPAMFYRLSRCDCADVRALYLAYMMMVDNAQVTDVDRLASPALGYTIAISELLSYEHESSVDLQKLDDTLLTSLQTGYTIVRAKELGWPYSTTDEYYHKWASRDIPMLMLQGSRDIRTTPDVGNITGDHLDGAHQYWVTVPNAGHGVIANSPVQNFAEPDCGAQIMLSWMQNPMQNPDTTCLADLKPYSFAGDSSVVTNLHATTDLYDNPPVALSCDINGVAGSVEARLEPDHLNLRLSGLISDVSQGIVTPVVSQSHLRIWGETRMPDSAYAVFYRNPNTFLAEKVGYAPGHESADVTGDVTVIPAGIADPMAAMEDIGVEQQPLIVTSPNLVSVASPLAYRQDMILDMQGELTYDSPKRQRFLLTRMTLPMDILVAAKESGGTYIPHMKGADRQFRVYVLEYEVKHEGMDTYTKSCPVAVDTDHGPRGYMYVCHGQNKTFAPGELLEMKLYVELTRNPATILDALGYADSCLCKKNNTETVDCMTHFYMSGMPETYTPQNPGGITTPPSAP